MSKPDRPFRENIESPKIKKYVVCSYNSLSGQFHATYLTKIWTIYNPFAKL